MHKITKILLFLFAVNVASYCAFADRWNNNYDCNDNTADKSVCGCSVGSYVKCTSSTSYEDFAFCDCEACSTPGYVVKSRIFTTPDGDSQTANECVSDTGGDEPPTEPDKCSNQPNPEPNCPSNTEIQKGYTINEYSVQEYKEHLRGLGGPAVAMCDPDKVHTSSPLDEDSGCNVDIGLCADVRVRVARLSDDIDDWWPMCNTCRNGTNPKRAKVCGYEKEYYQYCDCESSTPTCGNASNVWTDSGHKHQAKLEYIGGKCQLGNGTYFDERGTFKISCH